MDLMADSGAIDEKVFSLFVTNTMDPAQSGISSKLLIGGYDLTKYGKQGEEINWSELVTTNYWAVNLVGAKVKSTREKPDFDLDPSSNMAIVDSGTTYVLMPVRDHLKLRSHL